MFDRLYPDIYIKSIEQLPLKEFKRRGIKAFVFDIDNTKMCIRDRVSAYVKKPYTFI